MLDAAERGPAPGACPSSAIGLLVEAFQSRRPVRTWSLIVSVFGVVALPASRALKLTELQDWLAACGLEAGPVRTALSRLVAAGTLRRERDGKAALYRLSAPAEAEFRKAAALIHGPERPRPTGWIEIALIENGHGRKDLRAALAAEGFVPFTGGALIRPEHAGRAAPRGDGIALVRAEAGPDVQERAGALWPLAELADGYLASLGQADAVLRDPGRLSADEALLARILLVHEFRRVILRDPVLPAGLLPPDWPGAAARAQFDRAIKALEAAP